MVVKVVFDFTLMKMGALWNIIGITFILSLCNVVLHIAALMLLIKCQKWHPACNCQYCCSSLQNSGRFLGRSSSL